jgi:hypothetical protein
MGIEIDLLKNYPKTTRNVKERGSVKTEEDRAIAREFGKEFLTVTGDMATEDLIIIPDSGSSLYQPSVITLIYLLIVQF